MTVELIIEVLIADVAATLLIRLFDYIPVLVKKWKEMKRYE